MLLLGGTKSSTNYCHIKAKLVDNITALPMTLVAAQSFVPQVVSS